MKCFMTRVGMILLAALFKATQDERLLGATWLIRQIICQEFHLLFLRYFGHGSAKQRQAAREAKEHKCMTRLQKKKTQTKAQRCCLFAPLGGSEGTGPLVLTRGNTTVRLVSFVTENNVIFSFCRNVSPY